MHLAIARISHQTDGVRLGTLLHTLIIYCSSSVPGFLPASTKTSVSAKLTTAHANAKTAEKRNLFITTLTVVGLEGSALYVLCRWSPKSGSTGTKIFEE